MFLAKLSLQQAPPFSVPARFFMAAPLLGLITALLVIWSGQELIVSRWTPGMLAVTHGLVLGVFATVMVGALQQMLPVLAGAAIPRPQLFATLLFLFWVPGILLLIPAFLLQEPLLYLLAAILLAMAIVTFVGIALFTLSRASASGSSVGGIRLAVVSLLITLILGITLALGHTGVIPLMRPWMTNLHLSWGLVGWIGALIVTIAWQVVPLFQVTPGYPKWMRQRFVLLCLLLLAAKSLLILVTQHQLSPLLNIIHAGVNGGIALLFAAFAIVTLRLQNQAKRKLRDRHRDFWRLAMLNLLLAILFWLASQWTSDNWRPMLEMTAATLFLVGFALSVITGMLLKIISFLIWLHLKNINDQRLMQGRPGIDVPHMKGVIASSSSHYLFRLLILSQLALLCAIVYPGLALAAGLCYLLFFLLLTRTIGQALWKYYRASQDRSPLLTAHTNRIDKCH